jgi:hypothetical protein
MGMSTHVVGFVPPDEQWQKYRDVYFACQAAGIKLPQEIEYYFDGREPSENGMEIELEPNYGEKANKEGSVVRWQNEHGSGYEVDLSKLPKNVKHLRFYNSW